MDLKSERLGTAEAETWISTSLPLIVGGEDAGAGFIDLRKSCSYERVPPSTS